MNIDISDLGLAARLRGVMLVMPGATMTEPSGFRIRGESEPVLHKQVEEARSEELTALIEAAALVRTRATQQELEAAHRRCELARRKKQQLLEKLSHGGEA